MCAVEIVIPRAFSCNLQTLVRVTLRKATDVELIPHLRGLVNLVEANSLLALLNREHMGNGSSQRGLAVVDVANSSDIGVRLGAHEIRESASQDA